jgi:hypothetical protein
MSRQMMNLSASVLDRLRKQARERNLTFNEVLTYYGLERFLYRLSKSQYCDKFVLKGALVMLTWPGGPVRTTRDIDLRAFLSSDLEDVTRVIKEICTTEVEPDAIVFNQESIGVDVIVERVRPPGVRVRLKGYLDKVEIHIQIDLGFSDQISPSPRIVNYPTLLNMPAPHIHAYPPEAVVSEKAEAICYHGEVNSRMNDFYDIRHISRIFKFKGDVLTISLRTTFQTRGTAIPTNPSAILSSEFAESKQDLWQAFLDRIGDKNSQLVRFENVVEDISTFLIPPLNAARDNTHFLKSWSPDIGWN